jgi:hypothetical protein
MNPAPLQLEDRLQIFRVAKLYDPSGPGYQHAIFSAPVKRIEHEVGLYELLEDHRFVGEKGQRFYIEPNYRLSFKEARQDIIRGAMRDSNAHLEALAALQKDLNRARAITRPITEAEGQRLLDARQ